jgi:DnaJ-class molecular chaperone
MWWWSNSIVSTNPVPTRFLHLELLCVALGARVAFRSLARRGEGEGGDALVEISINPHRFFVRQDDDIHIELPITLSEAVLGARVKTPTPTGR